MAEKTIFEFTIHVAREPTEAQYGLMATQYDDMVSGSHGPVQVVSFYRGAANQVVAIESALRDLRIVGLAPVRIEI